MSIKRGLAILLAVFLLAGVCCSAASAFAVEKEAVINPSTSLVPGDKVTAVMEIKVPKGAVDTASRLSFDSPLAGDTWIIEIIKGGTVVNTKHPASPYLSITGWDLDYDTNIIVRITVSGTVSSESLGKEISVLKVTAAGMHDLAIQSYSSPKQKVNSAAEPRTTLAPTPTQKGGTEISTQNKVFQITKEAAINPSGSLATGESVTAVVEIKLPKGTVDTSGKISFNSPLAGDTWVVDIMRGGNIVNTKHPAAPYLYISGFDLDYETDITLRISVAGTVSSESSNKEISVLQVTASGMNTGSQSYASPKQFVYNIGILNSDLTILESAITTLDSKIALYQADGYNVETARTYTEQARSKYIAAQNAGTTDAAAAFANIEAGNELAGKALMELEQIISKQESEVDESAPAQTPTAEIKPAAEPTPEPTPEPAQTKKQEFSDEFKKFIRALIAWLEALIS